jgi:hypothetical protein
LVHLRPREMSAYWPLLGAKRASADDRFNNGDFSTRLPELIVTLLKDTTTVKRGLPRNFDEMGLFRRKVPRHFVRVHPDNIASKDWIILLEAGTIVGPSAGRLRVAAATQERRIVKKYNVFLRKQHFLVLETFDPRIHALYFCPQLYQMNSDNKLVPIEGEEIGNLIAQSVQDGVNKRRPWYEPSDASTSKPFNSNNVKDRIVEKINKSP